MVVEELAEGIGVPCPDPSAKRIPRARSCPLLVRSSIGFSRVLHSFFCGGPSRAASATVAAATRAGAATPEDSGVTSATAN
jgi:hypothetical protein